MQPFLSLQPATHCCLAYPEELDTKKNEHFKVQVYSFNFRIIMNLRYYLPKLEGQTRGSVFDEWCRKSKIVPFIEEAFLSGVLHFTC